MPNNFAPTYQVPIGGGHFRPSGPSGPENAIGGGWLKFSNDNPFYIPSTGGGSTPPVNQDMDVARWELGQIFVNNPLICGGLFGATDSRLVGYQNAFRCIVVRDINCPPDFKLRGLNGFEVVFYLGNVTEGVSLASGFPEDPPIAFYWSPDATIDQVTSILDANGKKMNRDLVIGRFRSHVFLCPEMGDPTETDTVAGAYNAWYQNNKP